MKVSNRLTKGISKAELLQIKKLAQISAQIELKRIELGMNEKQFAKYMQVSKRTISKWESGTYNFSLKTLVRVCGQLGLELTILDQRNDSEKVTNIQNVAVFDNRH